MWGRWRGDSRWGSLIKRLGGTIGKLSQDDLRFPPREFSHLISGSDLSFSSSLTVMLQRSSITVDDWEIRCKKFGENSETGWNHKDQFITQNAAALTLRVRNKLFQTMYFNWHPPNHQKIDTHPPTQAPNPLWHPPQSASTAILLHSLLPSEDTCKDIIISNGIQTRV